MKINQKYILYIISFLLLISLICIKHNIIVNATQKTPIVKLVSNANIGDKRVIKVKWNTIKNAQKYQIQRCYSKDYETYLTDVKTKNTKYTMKIDKNCVQPKYYVRVRAIYKNNRKGKWSKNLVVYSNKR